MGWRCGIGWTAKGAFMRKLLLASLSAGLVGVTAITASAAFSSRDRDFVLKATSSGLAAVAAAQLAQQRSASPQVRQFADRVIADHTQANSVLQDIAGQEDITLPLQPAGKDAAAVQRLRGLNGDAFDRAYAQDQLSNHEQDIALFRREANSGQDPELKAFAQKTLPILQQHLQLAQILSNTLR
jgi:putative membrane protein